MRPGWAGGVVPSAHTCSSKAALLRPPLSASSPYSQLGGVSWEGRASPSSAHGHRQTVEINPKAQAGPLISHLNCPTKDPSKCPLTDPRSPCIPPLLRTQASLRASPGDSKVLEGGGLWPHAWPPPQLPVVSSPPCRSCPTHCCTGHLSPPLTPTSTPPPPHPTAILRWAQPGGIFLPWDTGLSLPLPTSAPLPQSPSTTGEGTPASELPHRPPTLEPLQGTAATAKSGQREGAACLYSRENLVSSLLLCSHLNSSGQLPSAMHVSTRRFPSRCTCVLTGSVLK